MKNETDKHLTKVTAERSKLARLETQVIKQKALVQESERQLLKALQSAHQAEAPVKGQADAAAA